MGEKEGWGEKDGKMQKRERTSRITQGTLVLYNEKKKEYRECRVTELFNLDNEIKNHTEKIGFSNSHGNE